MRFTSLAALALVLFACEGGAPVGATCEHASDCSSPLVCRLARCRVECVANADCPVGADCLLDQSGLGSCSIAADHGCGSGGTTCPMPLHCANDRCVNTCSSMADCPPDGECRLVPEIGLSFCIAPMRDDAGAARDGGTPTDSGSDTSTDGGAQPTTDARGLLCVGGEFACAVRGTAVWCWGDNRTGQLGDGRSATAPNVHGNCGPDVGSDAGAGVHDCSSTAVRVIDEVTSQPLVAVAVACGETSACAITDAGRIACWGGNGAATSGDLAHPRPQRAHESTLLGGGYTQIVGGRDFFCASNGTGGSAGAHCWGSDRRGPFGTGETDRGHGDLIAPTGDAWAHGQLAAGSELMCMLDTVTGVITCAGQNDNGGVGPTMDFPMDHSMYNEVFTPPSRAVRVAAGDGFACAVMADHTLQSWGWGASGSLGRDAVIDQCTGGGTAGGPCDSVPSRVGDPMLFDDVWSGGLTSNACARDTSGQMWCWGYLGIDQCPFDGGHCMAPARAAPFDAALTVAMGISSMCALFGDGHVSCIGFQDYGQLGDGHVIAQPAMTSTPARVCFGGC